MKKADLKVGRWYMVEVKKPALPPRNVGNRMATPGAPPSRCFYRMQLVDFATNGRAIMCQTFTDWRWDSAYSFGDAMAGRCDKWPIKRNKFVTVTLGQLVGLAPGQAPVGATSIPKVLVWH